MKSLYESILDNDDVLFGNTKKDLNNPFRYVATLFDAGEDLSKYKYEIENIFDKFIKTLKPEKPIKVFVNDEKVAIWFTDKKYQIKYDTIIILRPGRIFTGIDNTYGVSNNSKMVIFFLEEFWIEDCIRYGFKTEDDFKKWIKDISKKYELEESKKDSLVYYML